MLLKMAVLLTIQKTKEYTRNETEMQEAYSRCKKQKTRKTAAEDTAHELLKYKVGQC